MNNSMLSVILAACVESLKMMPFFRKFWEKIPAAVKPILVIAVSTAVEAVQQRGVDASTITSGVGAGLGAMGVWAAGRSIGKGFTKSVPATGPCAPGTVCSPATCSNYFKTTPDDSGCGRGTGCGCA